MPIASEKLAPIQALYERGLCRQAYELACVQAPLRQWRDAPSRILAGRLANNLGAPNLGRAMHFRAFRDRPDLPAARYYYVAVVADRQGPLAGLHKMRRLGEPTDGDPELRSDWWAHSATLLARLRDFEAAEEHLEKARRLADQRPWLCIEKACVLQYQDRYAEALEQARQSLELQPWYRAGVQCLANLLQLEQRDQEALQLLRQATAQLESNLLWAQLAALQMELGLHAEAAHSYRQFAALSPLLEKDGVKWLAAQQADAAYYCGDFQAAADFARQAGTAYYDRFAERLTAGNHPAPKKLLPVGFVRQHHLTCAPATLAALAGYWNRTAEHLQIAEAICYDGTPTHSERLWAESNGFMAREFCLTWDSAVALLEAGVPCTLTTLGPAGGHLQALIGYDSLRQSLVVRDPTFRNSTEFIVEAMLRLHRAHGPRGMTVLPADQSQRLSGITLPEAELYDRSYALNRALEKHDRTEAWKHYEALQALAPGHRLTWNARWAISVYDADLPAQLESLENLLTLFPDDQVLQLARLTCLRELGRRDERLNLLQALVARKDIDPLFRVLYAQELRDDARQHPLALRLLRSALRTRPDHPKAYFFLGAIRSDQRRFEEAAELMRYASCLDNKDEHLAWSYFQAAHHIRRTEEALAWLIRRFQRDGHKSNQSVKTLFQALYHLDRMGEAFSCLEQALRRRPQDGDLFLYAAQQFMRGAARDRARELLAAAQGQAHPGQWLRCAAELAAMNGELAQALANWQQVLEREPLALDAHRRAAHLLAETQGRSAALAHLEASCRRFPYNCSLHELWVSWLREEGPGAVEPVVRRLVQTHPANSWAHRELASALGQLGRLEEAFAAAETARHLAPTHSSACNVLADLQERAGRVDQARAAFRQAIQFSVDNDYAIRQLVRLSTTPALRREALDFVRSELIAQVVYGDGLLEYRRQAQGFLDASVLLAHLQEALAARPDLWHAWSAVITQLTEMNRLDAALDLAGKATERFPLLPKLWLDLAEVQRLRQQGPLQVRALQQALDINPAYSPAYQNLFEAYLRDNDLAAARAALEKAIRLDPLHPVNHGMLAEVEWRAGNRPAALALLGKALELESNYPWGWNALRYWCHEQKTPGQAIAAARRLTGSKPGNSHSWLVLAETLQGPGTVEERLAALDKALALNPRYLEAHLLRTKILAEIDRYDEALAACRSTVWEGQFPVELRDQEAQLEMHRGRPDKAMELMKALLAEAPNYYAGWARLAEWQENRPEDRHGLAAAQRLVELAPTQANAWAYLADVKRRTGNREGAMQDLARSYELDPRHAFAGTSLFDLQLQSGLLKLAEQTLDLMKIHLGGDVVLVRQMRLALAKSDWPAAEQALAQLAASTGQDPTPFDQALTWTDEAPRWLRKKLSAIASGPQVNPLLASAYIRRLTKAQRWRAARKTLLRFRPHPPAWNAACRALMDECLMGRRIGELRRVIDRNADLIRDNLETWAHAGYVLSTAGDQCRAAHWLSDWKQHQPGLQPWMLLNLALALRTLNRNVEARQVSEAALNLPVDHTRDAHRIWLALDMVLAGETEQAAQLVAAVDAGGEPGYYPNLLRLVRAVLKVRQAGPEGRSAAYAEARAVIADPALARQERTPATRRAVCRAARCIAREVGGLGPWWWASRHRLVQPSAAPNAKPQATWKSLFYLFFLICMLIRAMAQIYHH